MLAALGPLAEQLDTDLACSQAHAVSTVVHDGAGARWSRQVHRHDGRLIVEFERLPPQDAHAPSPASLFAAIKAAATPEQLLQVCCDGIRRCTGFDRVMGYVFQPDDSGEVVAQSRAAHADSFLGMRFPASDIPAQARALYVRNTLRFIADVDDTPVPLVGAMQARALDLSGAVLRSVSPVHLQYLRHMGVQASMSVSIVIDNRLWGMFACHHHQALQVPQAVREACDMVAHFASTRIQTLLAMASAAEHQQAALLTGRLGGEYGRAEDPVRYLASVEAELRRALLADGLVISHKGKVMALGGVPHGAALSIARHFGQPEVAPQPRACREDWPAAMHEELGPWVGALPIDFDPAFGGRVVAMRREQITTVRWAGMPAKVVADGPAGPRLSPRGSFAEWRETVRGRSTAWQPVTLEIAAIIRTQLSRAAASHQLDMEDARRHLLAMLGHDLRDPLHAIRMAASFLKRDEDSRKLGTRIDNSSSRMQRLIAQVLDFSRAEAGLPLLGEVQEVDLAEMVDDLAEESRVAHPGVAIEVRARQPAMGHVDGTRLAQAVGNLLSNARHHAAQGTAIEVDVGLRDGMAEVVVSNVAPPIASALVRVLFDPFKRSERAPTNRSGLGLGLYITYRIALALGGDLVYGHRDGRVVFTLTARVGHA